MYVLVKHGQNTYLVVVHTLPISTQMQRQVRAHLHPSIVLVLYCCTERLQLRLWLILLWLGNRFVTDSGMTSQWCRRRVAVAGCKWALIPRSFEISKCYFVRLHTEPKANIILLISLHFSRIPRTYQLLVYYQVDNWCTENKNERIYVKR